MSAFTGIFERREATFPDSAFFISMESLAEFADGETGQWISSNIGFGHRKMSLLPEDAAETFPIRDLTAKLTITSDARIDNRTELFELLEISPAEQEIISDSRLILRAWEKWGRNCPQNLIGDYAFAIWDENEQTLFCARDHIGAKSFFYQLSSNQFIFSNFLNGLLSIPEISDELDEDFVIATLFDKRLYLPDRTYFASIRRLPPGSSITVTKDSAKIEKYWFPENAKEIRYQNEADYVENAREIYQRAVTDRLRTTEKVAVHLSGGLDSGSVAVLTNRELRKKSLPPPLAISWQPEPGEDEFSEREFEQINSIIEQENLSLLYCPVSPEGILSVFKKDPTREPIHITMIIENSVQQLAAQHGARLIMSGWGGDEGLSFNGRGFQADLLLKGRWLKFLQTARKTGSPFSYIAREIFLLFFADRGEGLRKFKARSLKARKGTKSFLKEELAAQVRLKQKSCRQTSIRSTMLWLWEIGILAERMESWRHFGAKLNLEYAYPLTDRRLMDFLIGLPPEAFMGENYQRRMMRKAMEGILPDKVCRQPDKREKVRVSHGIKTTCEAYALAREEILSAKEMPSRVKYFEIERLLDFLSPDSLAKIPKRADAIKALQFLDF